MENAHFVYFELQRGTDDPAQAENGESPAQRFKTYRQLGSSFQMQVSAESLCFANELQYI